jgi:tetratricopeptide (TPR) repeat protein
MPPAFPSQYDEALKRSSACRHYHLQPHGGTAGVALDLQGMRKITMASNVLGKELPPVRFSMESFLGILVAALLVCGLGSGVYKKIKHSGAVDAYRQGERNIANRDLKRALKDYTAAIRVNHRYYDAYCRRAEVYAELGDRADAENDVRQAISIHPLWPFALDLRRQFAHSQRNGPWFPVSDSFDLQPVIH